MRIRDEEAARAGLPPEPNVRCADMLDRPGMDVPVARAGTGGVQASWARSGWFPRPSSAMLFTECATARARAIAVNLLMRVVRRGHNEACVESRIDVAVIAFRIDRALINSSPNTACSCSSWSAQTRQARQAIAWGAEGLIAQGCEAGGNLTGDIPS